MKTALLIVDMQEAFKSLDVCRESFAIAIPTVQEAIRLFRNQSLPVAFIRTNEANKLNVHNGYSIIAELNCLETDLFVDKKFPNAFWKSLLEDELRKRDVTHTVICGCFTWACVYLTHHGALERGFRSAVLKNGTVASDPESPSRLLNAANHISVDECGRTQNTNSFECLEL